MSIVSSCNSMQSPMNTTRSGRHLISQRSCCGQYLPSCPLDYGSYSVHESLHCMESKAITRCLVLWEIRGGTLHLLDCKSSLYSCLRHRYLGLFCIMMEYSFLWQRSVLSQAKGMIQFPVELVHLLPFQGLKRMLRNDSNKETGLRLWKCKRLRLVVHKEKRLGKTMSEKRRLIDECKWLRKKGKVLRRRSYKSFQAALK